MNTSKTNEQAFEALIEKALVGSTNEERMAAGQTDVDAQAPAGNQYYWGQSKDFDKKLAIDLRRLWAFLEATQQDALNEYKGKDLKMALPKQIAKDIETFGVIKVLREGVDVDNIHVSLFIPNPRQPTARPRNRNMPKTSSLLRASRLSPWPIRAWRLTWCYL